MDRNCFFRLFPCFRCLLFSLYCIILGEHRSLPNLCFLWYVTPPSIITFRRARLQSQKELHVFQRRRRHANGSSRRSLYPCWHQADHRFSQRNRFIHRRNPLERALSRFPPLRLLQTLLLRKRQPPRGNSEHWNGHETPRHAAQSDSRRIDAQIEPAGANRLPRSAS